MASIEVGFSTSTGIVSRVIRWFTRSCVSHAWVAFECGELGIRLIMHATAGGYVLNRWDRWKRKNRVVARFACSEDLGEGLRMMAHHLGSEYDYKSALMLAFRRWFGHRIFRNPVRDSGLLHCSEAIALLLRKHGFAQDLDPESTTPEDLLRFCLATPAFALLSGDGPCGG